MHAGGILYYHSACSELILIPVMIAGALPFKLYYLIVENRRWSLFGDEQVKLFFIVLAAGAAVLTYDLVFFSNLDIPPAFHQGLFMAVSALTTTGFQTAALHSVGERNPAVPRHARIHRGCSGSTAGGIKLNRVALAYPGADLVVPAAVRERQGPPPLQDRRTGNPESNCRTRSCQEHACHHPVGHHHFYCHTCRSPVPSHIILLHGNRL